MQMMAGRRGLNGPIVLCRVGGASSSVGALATVLITTVREPLCRPATATSRSVTSAVSSHSIFSPVGQKLKTSFHLSDIMFERCLLSTDL